VPDTQGDDEEDDEPELTGSKIPASQLPEQEPSSIESKKKDTPQP